MNDDEVLLKLRRKWTKDEEVALITAGLERQLSERDFEIGQLKSYICELEDKLAETKFYQTQVIEPLQKKIEHLNAINWQLTAENNTLTGGDIIATLNGKIAKQNKELKEKQLTINSLISRLPK